MLVVSHCLLLCRVRTREFVPSRIRTSHFHPRYRFPEPTHFAEMISLRECVIDSIARDTVTHTSDPPPVVANRCVSLDSI